jgi:hypothetical protein
MIARRLWTGALAIMVGCLLNYVGDKLLGIRIELFWGLQTFNFLWFLQLFILPVLVGMSVSFIYGLGGKWLCYIPPIIVRFIAYYETLYITGTPEGASLMPMAWWGFFVIIAIECAAIGGVAGEILIKRIYGRTSKEEADRSLIKPSSSQNEQQKPSAKKAKEV